MKRAPIFFSALALTSALAAGALAQSVAQSSHSPQAWTDFPGGADALPGAVGRIEAETGGKVLEIRFTKIDGNPGFSAALVKDGVVSFLHAAVDAGAVVTISADSVPVSMLHWRGRTDVRLAQKAEVSLTDAIRTAEAANGGEPAVAAGLAPSATSTSSDIHAYNILLAQGSRTRRISIDDSTGQVIENPSELSGRP